MTAKSRVRKTKKRIKKEHTDVNPRPRQLDQARIEDLFPDRPGAVRPSFTGEVCKAAHPAGRGRLIAAAEGTYAPLERRLGEHGTHTPESQDTEDLARLYGSTVNHTVHRDFERHVLFGDEEAVRAEREAHEPSDEGSRGACSPEEVAEYVEWARANLGLELEEWQVRLFFGQARNGLHRPEPTSIRTQFRRGAGVSASIIDEVRFD